MKGEVSTYLARYDVPSKSLNRAVQSLNDFPNQVITSMVGEFDLNVTDADQLRAAKCVVDAILRGASSAESIRTHVYKRVTEVRPEPVPDGASFTTMAGMPGFAPVDGMIATPVKFATEAGSGVRRKANSAFSRAVSILDDARGASRAELLEMLAAVDIKKSSAMVYLWKYKNGERS